jgi:argininosuccinate synthase
MPLFSCISACILLPPALRYGFLIPAEDLRPRKALDHENRSRILGGLDTSVILKWLQLQYKAEVIAFCADVGQEEELDEVPAKAKATGASKCYIVDLVEEFASDFIYPMIQANAIYEGQYFLGTSIARPLIAKAHIEIARKEGATAVAHGATGKGNDQCRFELTYAAWRPNSRSSPRGASGISRAAPT